LFGDFSTCFGVVDKSLRSQLRYTFSMNINLYSCSP